MKKIKPWWCIILFVCMIFTTAAQAPAKVERDGKTFIVTKVTKQSEIILTDYYYNTGEETYRIYINKASGRCFINKTSSKTGKQYRYYLPEQISRQICLELGITYKEKEV